MVNLIQKVEKNGISYFQFEDNGATMWLPLDESLKLVTTTPSTERNCRIISGVISLKNGTLRTRKVQTPRMKAIYIYTEKKYTKQKHYLECNDLIFTRIVKKADFLKKHANLIYAIDKARIIDYSLGKIETPYGIAGVEDFSTGLKTLLNIHYCLRSPSTYYLVNVNECGDNVFKYIFPAVEGTNVSLFIEHAVYFLPDEFEYVVNDNLLDDRMKLFDIVF